MSRAIGDAAAISFAIAFYQALGFGKDVKTAFELGCSQIDLEGINEQDTPKLVCVNCDPKTVVFVQEDTAKMPKPSVEEIGGALAIWREKLHFLQEQEAVIADPQQRFTLRKQIEEVKAKIQQLGG
jgi:hypothetical protein